MITLHEEIVVPRSVEHCFRYVADFRSAKEWDATATRADKLTPGPVGLGTKFDLDCAVGPGSINLVYEIVEYQPWHSLVLHGRGRYFDVRDTIVFSEHPEGTHIDYTAEFTYRSGLERFAKRFESGMRAMGAQSLAGLKNALLDANPVPELSAGAKRADHWVVPGVAMFSRYGYTRGARQWLPVTQYMDNKHVLITGANSGLGLSSALALAEAGAKLTLVIRNAQQVDWLKEEIHKQTGRDDVGIELADLSLMADVESLCQRLLAKAEPIDVLINNAGALFNERALTSEGIERSFALLLLSPWHLTRQLHPLLANHSTPARVINVVSGGMYTEKLVCKRLIMREETYAGPAAYARSKRGLTVLSELWAQAWKDDNIVVNAMHPGWADTPGVQSALPTFRSVTRRILRSAEEGADTIVWLARATEADKISGKLFLDREPRTPYLLKRTVESPEERAQLEEFLARQLAQAMDQSTQL